jgi:hypothetical protein
MRPSQDRNSIVYSKDPTEVIRELGELRRGRGLDATDLHLRTGPVLRAACGIVDSDTPAQSRRKLILRLTELCGGLPEDLKMAALAALALHEEASGEFLDRRIAWLAAQYDRDPRTARRRVDRALARLGERLQGDVDRVDDVGPYVPAGWYVERFKAVLRLNLARPLLVEERGIVTTVDELDEIVVAVSTPRDLSRPAGRPIDANMVYGGEIVERDQVSQSHARFVVRLPKPLRLGQRHEYSIEFSVESRSALRPYYVLTPLRRCEFFSVRVCFGIDAQPQSVWRVNGLPARVVDDFLPGVDLLTVDSLGDVQAEFHSLQQGLSYGLQWCD